MIKPGYRTSEFWFTVVSFIFSGLFLLGIIGDPSYKDELIRDISHGVESVILIGGQIIILYNYLKHREHIKEVDIIVEGKKDERRISKPTKRTPKTGTTTRTRKSSKGQQK